MNNNIKVVLFDMGEVVYTLYRYEEFGLCLNKDINPIEFKEWMIKTLHCSRVDLMKNSGSYIVEQLKEYTNSTLTDDEIISKYIEYRGFIPYDVVETFRYLQAKEIDLGILSNVDTILAKDNRRFEESFGFKYFLQSSEIGINKPNLRMYLEAERITNCKSDEILFIDNLEQNLRLPRELGWKTICYCNKTENDLYERVKEIV